MKRNLILLGFLSILIACSSTSKKTEVNFKNTFTVTNSNCAKWNLPEVEFSIQYPDSIELTFPIEDTVNNNYISMVCREGEKNFEELTIGWFRGSGSLDFMNLGDQLLKQFEAIFKSVYDDAKTVYKGKKDFADYDDIYQLQMEYKVVDNSLGMDPGEYKLLMALVPNADVQKNGVMAFFQCNEDNKTIKRFSDFGEKGLSGKIWSTFKFN